MILKPNQIAQYAYDAGFRGYPLVLAVAVSLAESGGNALASNFNPPTSGCPNGSTDRGLWQINNCYHSEVPDTCAYDPLCCAQVAYRISGGGTQWQWWSTFEGGQYRAHLNEAQVAASEVNAPRVPPKVHNHIWHHELHPWQYRSQIRMPIQAGYPRDNANDDCGPACISMVIEHITGIYISEDRVLATEYWKGYTGETSDVNMMHYFNSEWGWATYESVPKSIKAARRIEDTAIRMGYPIIELGWIFINGKRLGHFRVCTGITSRASIMANPANGRREVENKNDHWNSCQRAQIVIQRKRR